MNQVSRCPQVFLISEQWSQSLYLLRPNPAEHLQPPHILAVLLAAGLLADVLLLSLEYFKVKRLRWSQQTENVDAFHQIGLESPLWACVLKNNNGPVTYDWADICSSARWKLAFNVGRVAIKTIAIDDVMKITSWQTQKQHTVWPTRQGNDAGFLQHQTLYLEQSFSKIQDEFSLQSAAISLSTRDPLRI